jgi:glycerol kinase
VTLTAAIDLGTTTVRVGLFDDAGARVAIARDTLSLSVPFAGAVEQDPDEFVSSCLRLLAAVLDEVGAAAGDVDALGITNQRSSIVAWDVSTGRALRPVVGWQDTRTADVVSDFIAQGIALTTSASCTKLGWLVAHDPDVSAAAARGTLRLGTVDTWLTWALSGGAVHVTDPSNAGATGLYDLRLGDWSDGAMALFGVPRGPLAEIVASDAVVGVTVAELLGAEIPLAARLGDQMAACAAHGMVEGMAKLTLGTSGMFDIGAGTTPVDAPEGCYTLPLWRRSISGETVEEYVVEGSINTAGSVIEWLVRVGLLPRVDMVNEVAAAGRPGLEFVPALAGLGSPHHDPTARGSLRGLALDTTAADIVRSVIDGIAARAAELADHMGVTGPLIVDGGLSQCGVLLDEIATRSGLTVVAAGDPETTLKGIAAVAAGAGR